MTPFSPEAELKANRFYLKADQSMLYGRGLFLERSKIVSFLNSVY